MMTLSSMVTALRITITAYRKVGPKLEVVRLEGGAVWGQQKGVIFLIGSST